MHDGMPDGSVLGVLIVDQEEAFLDEAARVLRSIGVPVRVARTPLAAVWALEREPVAVVVCDWSPLVDQVRDQYPGVQWLPREAIVRDPVAAVRAARRA